MINDDSANIEITVNLFNLRCHGEMFGQVKYYNRQKYVDFCYLFFGIR